MNLRMGVSTTHVHNISEQHFWLEILVDIVLLECHNFGTEDVLKAEDMSIYGKD